MHLHIAAAVWVIVVLVELALAALVGYWCYRIWVRKGRSPAGGFALGFFLTLFLSLVGAIIAVVVSYLLSERSTRAPVTPPSGIA